MNVAATATATASSQNTPDGQGASSSIDGFVDGYPGDYTKEWATAGGRAGSWLQLTWPTAQTLSSVVLFDRPNLNDQVTSGHLVFSDGSTVSTGALNNAGSATTVTFTARSATAVQFVVDSVSATTVNVGLAEIQAWGSAPAATTTPTVTLPSGTNIASQATLKASPSALSTSQAPAYAVDGKTSTEWVTKGGTAGSSLSLTYSSAKTVTAVVLSDRLSLSDQVLAGTLTFSNGTKIQVGALSNDGSATIVTVPSISTKSVRFDITSVSTTTTNVGLAEIGVYTP